MEQKPECCCKFPTDRMIKVFWPGVQPGGQQTSFLEQSEPSSYQAADTCFQAPQMLLRKGHVRREGEKQ